MKKFFILLILFIVVLLGYSFYLAPQIITVHEYSVTNELIPEGFDGIKIVHFSDLLYANESPQILDKLVNKINEQNPDIVVFTGDLTNGKISKKKQTELLKSLNKINSTLGKFAILGDKDSQFSEKTLTDSNFTIINEQVAIYNNDVTPIYLLNDCQIEDEPHTFSICLIHKPDDIKKYQKPLASLILAGHSLGGQIQVPFWGALIKEKGAQKYSDRYYVIDDSQMYISYGIGNGNLNLRIFNEPSINVYRLKGI